MIFSDPLNKTLFGGLNEDDFFITAFGSRKGIVDKTKFVPKSGHLERTNTTALSIIEIIENDCKTPYGFPITIQSKIHAKSLINRYFLDESNKSYILYDESMYDQTIGKQLLFRSPIICYSDHYCVCQTCFGKYDKIKTKYVGIISGQVVSERLLNRSI
jgi:hypothetical protein